MYIPFFTVRKRRREFRKQFNEWKQENCPYSPDEEAIKTFLAPILEVYSKLLAAFECRKEEKP